MQIKEFDISIIGGGIIGTTIATLASIRSPEKNIAILDKNLIGKSTTLYSGGLSTPLAKTEFSKKIIERTVRVANEVNEYLPSIINKKKCFFVVSDNHADHFNKCYTKNDLITVQADFLEETSLSTLMKIPKEKNIFFSEESTHSANPSQCVESMGGFLRKRNCSIFESCLVENIITNSDGVIINGNGGFLVKSKKVIIAIGPWGASTKFLGKIDPMENYIKNKKVAALHLNIVPNTTDPVIVFFDEDAFLLPLPERGHWLFSFTSLDWGCNPKDDMYLSKDDFKIANNILEKYSFNLNDVVSGGRVFCDAYSDNKEFIIKKNNEFIMFVNGASGSGYRFAFGIAEKVLEEI